AGVPLIGTPAVRRKLGWKATSRAAGGAVGSGARSKRELPPRSFSTSPRPRFTQKHATMAREHRSLSDAFFSGLGLDVTTVPNLRSSAQPQARAAASRSLD